nr:chromobox protein 1 [Hymenolepis microstoma]
MSDTEWEVEKILDVRTHKGVKEYLLKWVGYDESESTWEPQENLSCRKLLSEFEKRNRLRKRTKISTSRKDATRIVNAKSQHDNTNYLTKWKACSVFKVVENGFVNQIKRFDIVQENSPSSNPLTKPGDEEKFFQGDKAQKPTSNDRDNSTEEAEKVNTRTRNIAERFTKSFAKRRGMEAEGSFNSYGPGKTPTIRCRRRRQSVFRPEDGQLKKRKMYYSEAGLNGDGGTNTGEVTVYGVTTINGNLMFIIHIAGVPHPFLMTPNEANVRYPDAVIQFYEKQLTFRIPQKK